MASLYPPRVTSLPLESVAAVFNKLAINNTLGPIEN